MAYQLLEQGVLILLSAFLASFYHYHKAHSFVSEEGPNFISQSISKKVRMFPVRETPVMTRGGIDRRWIVNGVITP